MNLQEYTRLQYIENMINFCTAKKNYTDHTQLPKIIIKRTH